MNIPELPIQVVAVSESNPVDNKDVNQALNIQVKINIFRVDIGLFYLQTVFRIRVHIILVGFDLYQDIVVGTSNYIKITCKLDIFFSK